MLRKSAYHWSKNHRSVHPWRTYALLLTVILLITALAACGEGDSTETASGPDTSRGDAAREPRKQEEPRY